MKKILSAIITGVFVAGAVAPAYAAAPKVVFDLDCDTQEKQVGIGYQSDPDSPANGPEVIALKFIFEILTAGTSTFDDIKDVNLMANSAFSNFIVAENNKTQNGNVMEITFAGGFTGGNGAPQAADLIYVKGINQKAFEIKVKSGEIYPKNSTTNIYQSSNESFVANPNSCAQNTNQNTNTNTNTTPSNTSTTTNTTTTTNNQTTSIQLSSNKQAPTLGESVEVTAIISNRNNQSIDWSQTAGAQIAPQINNEELPDGTTKSVLSFTMVNSAQDLVLKLTIGNKSEQITIKATPARPAANTTTGTETEPDTTTGTQQTGTSLQDRLQQRREELNEQATPTPAQTAQPTNVHNAAGGLSQSGPAETGMLMLMALAGVYLWRKIKRSEVDVNV